MSSLSSNASFCPYCGNSNSMYLENCSSCGKPIKPVNKLTNPDSIQVAPINRAYTIKFSTIVFFILGVIVPLWLISLPIFWGLAYWSYKKDSGI